MTEVAEVERLFSRLWWESRTNNELQEMVRGGLAGQSGAGAHLELERRARELRKAEEHEAELHETHKTALRVRILGSAFLAMLLALLALEFSRLRGH
jgi:hypothetical protein